MKVFPQPVSEDLIYMTALSRRNWSLQDSHELIKSKIKYQLEYLCLN